MVCPQSAEQLEQEIAAEIAGLVSPLSLVDVLVLTLWKWMTDF